MNQVLAASFIRLERRFGGSGGFEGLGHFFGCFYYRTLRKYLKPRELRTKNDLAVDLRRKIAVERRLFAVLADACKRLSDASF